MTTKLFRDGSLNFFSYDEKYLVCKRYIYVPVYSNVELQSVLKQNLPVHTLTSFFLSCFCKLHSHIRLRFQIVFFSSH